jgi:hypothetical protein
MHVWPRLDAAGVISTCDGASSLLSLSLSLSLSLFLSPPSTLCQIIHHGRLLTSGQLRLKIELKEERILPGASRTCRTVAEAESISGNKNQNAINEKRLE